MNRTVLCFGDSNTWGYAPGGGRYGADVRWPRRMGAILGGGYDVIEEGLNGRTCLFDDPVEGGFKCGAQYLPPCLMSHSPLDLVILMLGTNDTKQRFAMNAFTIAQAAGELVQLALRYARDGGGRPAKVLLASPILVGEGLMRSAAMGPIFGPDAIGISRGLAAEYRKVALLHGAAFLDASRHADPSPMDSIHMSADGQRALAQAMAGEVRALLG